MLEIEPVLKQTSRSHACKGGGRWRDCRKSCHASPQGGLQLHVPPKHQSTVCVAHDIDSWVAHLTHAHHPYLTVTMPDSTPRAHANHPPCGDIKGSSTCAVTLGATADKNHAVNCDSNLLRLLPRALALKEHRGARGVQRYAACQAQGRGERGNDRGGRHLMFQLTFINRGLGDFDFKSEAGVPGGGGRA